MAMMLNRGDRGSAIPTELKFGEPYFIPGTGLFIGNEDGVPEKVSGSESLGSGENTAENTVKEYVTKTEVGTFMTTHNIKKLVSIKPVANGSDVELTLQEFPLSHFKTFNDNYNYIPENVPSEVNMFLNPKTLIYHGPDKVMVLSSSGETILLVEYVPEISETFDTEIVDLMGVVSADTILYGGEDGVVGGGIGNVLIENKNNVYGYFQFFPPVTNATYEWILTFPDLSEEIISVSPDRFFGWLVKDINDLGTFDTTAIYKLRAKMVWNGLEFESNNFEFSINSLKPGEVL